jgi:cation:H+ antiporter
MSLIVLVGGWFATQSADVLASQTGLGSAFLGATLLAAATSLPEVSTTIAAARSGRYTVAISNIFGSNALDLALLFLADLLFRGSTILAHAQSSVVFVGSIGAIMTCVYLWGLIERENRTVLGIGWDSAVVLLVYAVAMSVLYAIT